MRNKHQWKILIIYFGGFILFFILTHAILFVGDVFDFVQCIQLQQTDTLRRESYDWFLYVILNGFGVGVGGVRVLEIVNMSRNACCTRYIWSSSKSHYFKF